MKHHVMWTHLPNPPLAVLLIPIPIPSAAAAPAPASPAALGDYWLRDIPPARPTLSFAALFSFFVYSFWPPRSLVW